MAPARRRPAARAPSKRASSASRAGARDASRAGARDASRASPSPSTTAWTVLSRLFATTFSRRAARREDVERRRTRARALAVACVACAATYLREVYVPAAVRDTFVDSLPDWVNDTVLARLPALELQPETRSRARGPGVELRERGLTPKHPVVIVPGFVSTGLELWRGKACGAHFFDGECGERPRWRARSSVIKSVGWNTCDSMDARDLIRNPFGCAPSEGSKALIGFCLVISYGVR